MIDCLLVICKVLLRHCKRILISEPFLSFLIWFFLKKTLINQSIMRVFWCWGGVMFFWKNCVFFETDRADMLFFGI